MMSFFGRVGHVSCFTLLVATLTCHLPIIAPAQSQSSGLLATKFNAGN